MMLRIPCAKQEADAALRSGSLAKGEGVKWVETATGLPMVGHRRRDEIARAEARAAGRSTYLSVFPCSHGHMTFYVISNKCEVCVKTTAAADRSRRRVSAVVLRKADHLTR